MGKFLDKVGVSNLWNKIKSSFLSLSGGTMKNTTIVKNLNAEYVGGKSLNELFTFRGYYDETNFPNSIPHTVSGVYKGNNPDYTGIAVVFHNNGSNSEIMFNTERGNKPKLYVGKDSNRWYNYGEILTDLDRIKYINVTFNNSPGQTYFDDIHDLVNYTLRHGDVIRFTITSTDFFYVNMIHDVIIEGSKCIVGRFEYKGIIYALIWRPETNHISVLKHDNVKTIAILHILSDQAMGVNLTMRTEMRFTFVEYMNILGLERLNIQVNWEDLQGFSTEDFCLDFKCTDDNILESVAPITNFKEIGGEMCIVTIKRIIISKNTEIESDYSVVYDSYNLNRNTIIYDNFTER